MNKNSRTSFTLTAAALLAVVALVSLLACQEPVLVARKKAADQTSDEPAPEYWNDGDLYQYKTHTVGTGVPIFIYGHYFDHGDLQKETGAWEVAARGIADLILACPVVRDFIDYFDIYLYMREDSVSPIPDSGWDMNYVWQVNGAISASLSPEAAAKAVWLFVGNCVGANNQVGGYAYFNKGAVYSLGVEPKPFYWMFHELLGHAFTGLYDEYDGPGATLPNIVARETTPTAADVPWGAFIGKAGYTGFSNSNLNIGIVRGARHDDGYYWRATDNCFMRDNPNYQIPGYQRYLIYKRIMEKADMGTDGYLQAFFDYDSVRNTGIIDWDSELVSYKP